jgi:2-C-methyl-D-erythritol 2,4-cyclodiphosphate synthase
VKVGIGYDVHRLVPGRPLILGGVNIPFEKGLLGHSDADVVCHAIVDAILGAANLGDIGTVFSDKDPRWKNISSLVFLRNVKKMINDHQYEISNIDTIVIAERPQISRIVPKMVEQLAEALSIHPSMISIKATTSEGLGFIGTGEGIAAQAAVLLIRK